MKSLIIVGFALLAISGLNAFQYKTSLKKLSLKDALGMPDANDLDIVDINVGNSLNRIVDKLMDEDLATEGILFKSLESAIDNFLEVTVAEKTHIAERITALLTKIKGKLQDDPLRKIIAKVIGLRNSTDIPYDDDEGIVNEVATQTVENITSPEGLQKIRNYIDNFSSKTQLEVVHALQGKMHEIDDIELKKCITALLSGIEDSPISVLQTFKSIKTLIHDFGVSLMKNYSPFRKWINIKWALIKVRLADQVSLVKARLANRMALVKVIGQELMAHGKGISRAVAVEAKSLFTKYKSALGDDYDPLMKRLLGIIEETNASHKH